MNVGDDKKMLLIQKKKKTKKAIGEAQTAPPDLGKAQRNVVHEKEIKVRRRGPGGYAARRRGRWHVTSKDP